MTPVIEAHSLHKSFGAVHAVRGIDLTVERGSIYGLIGPNGAGKSTVLRILVDLIRPDSGEISVLGSAPQSASPALRRRIGYLPGEVQFHERCDGRSLLERFASISGRVPPGRIDALAERLDLDLARPVRSLSKGNRQKLGLIQAFMHPPELLILDEPTSGLDLLMQREFMGLVREAQDNGQTVLLSSHILGEIQYTADAAAVLAQGSIVAHGDVASLRLAGTSRIRAAVAGADPEQLSVQLEQCDGLSDLVVLRFGAATGTATSAEADPSSNVVQVSGLLRGEPDATIKALANYTIRDLALAEPDLEESVLELYGHSENAS